MGNQMNPSDMVFDAVYKGALKRGAVDRHANDQAVIAVEDYRKNKFKQMHLQIFGQSCNGS